MTAKVKSQRVVGQYVPSFLYSKKVMPYIFVAPFVISFLVFFLYPTCETVWMSFQKMSGFKSSTFYGIGNYTRLLNNHFGNAVKNNTIYTILTILIQIPMSIVMAVLLNFKTVKFRNAFRSAIFIPSLVSALIAGIAFRLMFSDMASGLFNQILGVFGVKPIAWNMGYWTGMVMMVVLNAWKSIGINMIYCLSALQSIPEDIYESADIDGATEIQKFFRITLPLLKPTIAYIMTLTIIAGYRMFTESYVYWVDSTPGDIGLTIVRYIYNESFQSNDMGFGAAIGIVLLAILMIVNLFQLRGFGMMGKEDK